MTVKCIVNGKRSYLRKERQSMSDEEDFLEELIAESTRRNPEFPQLMEAAAQRRREARARGEDPNAEPEEDEADNAEEQSTTSQAQR